MTNIRLSIFLAFSFLTSCVKEDLQWNLYQPIPTVRTGEVSSVVSTQANASGEVTSEGDSYVTVRGFCISTSTMPDLDDIVYDSGAGEGFFTAALSNLTPETTYYVRAYAKNDLGTGYGKEVAFTTEPPVPSVVDENNCGSLSGTTSLYEGMNGTSGSWGIGSSGYSGSCWQAPNPSSSGQLGTAIGTHYVEFVHMFENNGFIEFWLNTSNPGYNNLFPSITVDGFGQSTPEMIDGNASGFYWMKVRSADIAAGTHTIRITFTGSYYVFKLDEIEFYEYQ